MIDSHCVSVIQTLIILIITEFYNDRKQAEKDYDVVTGTRYAQGGGVSSMMLLSIVIVLLICMNYVP